MAHITYFTKPGCLTSGKQVDLLRQSGHEVEVRDLLSHPWEPEELISYFGEMPVKLWFNPNSPRVKSGEIDPSAYDSAAALNLMREDHLLIRRPLMGSGGIRVCGFDPVKIHAWVGLSAAGLKTGADEDYTSCLKPSTTIQQCQ